MTNFYYLVYPKLGWYPDVNQQLNWNTITKTLLLIVHLYFCIHNFSNVLLGRQVNINIEYLYQESERNSTEKDY